MKYSRLLSVVLIVVMAALCLSAQNQPQASTKDQPMDPQVEKDRRYALDLYDQAKYVEALPWLEKVEAALPLDVVVKERLSMCLVMTAETLPSFEERKAMRIRARKLMLRAKELGDESDLLVTMIGMTSEDGADRKYSNNQEIHRLMQAGETAFAAGKLDEAKENYLRVLVIEPKNYHAQLFIGDVYFRQKEWGAACEWFKRAVDSDATLEAAYRYWGDALLNMGKFSDARMKYIEAVAASPYDRSSWNGINKWVQFANGKLTWYKIQSPNKVEFKDDKNVNITINAANLGKEDGSTAWMMYEMSRALWHGEKFTKEFPGEKKYRHTLKEEAEALTGVATVAEELTGGKKKKSEKLPEDLKILIKLKKAGFIEPYVLLNGADAEIAQDYDAYRDAHREVIIRYLDEIVVPPVPKEQTSN